MQRKIIHVDMDAFFASIEQKRHPEFRGKPVVVGGDGDPHKRGVVSAASYEARRYGIHSAMPLRVAYRKCPHAIFLPVDIDKYAEVSEKVMKILHDYSDSVEEAGLDEAYLDVSQSKLSALEIAQKIKNRIRKELGLTASVGIGPNKLIAKIASNFSKPNGLTAVPKNQVKEFLWPLPVSKLWGVGPKTEAKLKDMGIHKIEDLARTSIEILAAEFGQAHAQMLHEYSMGIDDSPIITYWEPKSMSRQVTFQYDTTNLMQIKRTILEISRDLQNELREENYRARTVELKIRYSNFQTVTHSRTKKEPIERASDIYDRALELLPLFDLKRKVRLVGLGVSNLEKMNLNCGCEARLV